MADPGTASRPATGALLIIIDDHGFGRGQIPHPFCERLSKRSKQITDGSGAPCRCRSKQRPENGQKQALHQHGARHGPAIESEDPQCGNLPDADLPARCP